ncbi:diguanylate cyclase domain-containing protein [Hydrogenoanaerobacterium sp.]|uniref:diguanylate cyclase domain-containing protein n=1 Tax=Hydrogenoanaerobacterium sp. TaxID=2953763 RepID=UPI002899D2AF|nr:diguanylate cyclase [Hydrogenoanaerobacterium sp.]
MDEISRTVTETEDITLLESIANNIMGAIMSCKDDRWFTINYASLGLLRLTGFTGDELRDRFQNRFILLVYPMDLERMLNEYTKQRSTGDAIELEYRLICKNGNTVWVLEKGNLYTDESGSCFYFCMLFDVTERKNAQLQQAIRYEHYRRLMEQEGDVLIEWTIENDTLLCSSNFKSKFGYDLPCNCFLSSLLEHDLIHEADKPLFQQRLQTILSGTAPSDGDLRLKKASGEYIWCKLRSSILYNEDGAPQKIMCILSDIDKQKKERLLLEAKAQRDLLTGAYNKVTAQSLIEDYLSDEGKDGRHALFVIDVDNFKSINDRLGHLQGDSVLSSISSCIAKQFRPTDVVGRVGGDEFMVLLKNIPSIDLVEQKAKHLVHIFRKILTDQQDEITISGSIGVAIYPDHGHQFGELFQKADAALYFSKGHGKDCYQLYNSDLVPHSEKNLLCAEQSLRRDLARCIFEILYDMKEIRPAIRHILGITGRYYSVPHVYIFESRMENGRLRWENTFEWCADIDPPFADKPFAYLSTRPVQYLDLFDSNGIFCCNNISSLPTELADSFSEKQICSVLQCAIVQNGYIKGFVGFSEGSAERVWNMAEIEAVTLISKILGVFLLSDHSHYERQQSTSAAESILEHMKARAYVVRKDDYQVMYANYLARERHPELAIGKTCFGSLSGSPCSHCPVGSLDETQTSCTVEFCNDSQMWSECTASKIKWVDGSDACLIICNDIVRC